jgi:glucose-6-phosphate 1-epimerase
MRWVWANVCGKQDISAVSITGLESASYIDKVAATTATSSSSSLSITSRTDRVYTPAGGPSTPIIVSEAGKKRYTVVRDNMSEVVVWNPWADGVEVIGDFEPKEGYKEMICVEAGAVKGWQKLEAGETWEGGQVLLAH